MKNETRLEQEKKRTPVHSQGETLIHNQDPNFYYRWCADYDKGKLSKYLAAGYEYVKGEDGERQIKPGKYPLYLMRLPMKFREEDLLQKKNKIITINKDLQHKVAPQGGAVPDYIPKGQNSVLSRDDL
jgi:hypothetical protein